MVRKYWIRLILISRYLIGDVDEHQTVADFNLINNSSNLNWSFKSQVTKFIKRFLKDPYRSDDTEWIKNLAATKGFSIKEKLAALSKLCNQSKHWRIMQRCMVLFTIYERLITTQQTRLGMSRKPRLLKANLIFLGGFCYIKNYSPNRTKSI